MTVVDGVLNALNIIGGNFSGTTTSQFVYEKSIEMGLRLSSVCPSAVEKESHLPENCRGTLIQAAKRERSSKTMMMMIDNGGQRGPGRFSNSTCHICPGTSTLCLCLVTSHIDNLSRIWHNSVPVQSTLHTLGTCTVPRT